MLTPYLSTPSLVTRSHHPRFLCQEAQEVYAKAEIFMLGSCKVCTLKNYIHMRDNKEGIGSDVFKGK